MFSSMSAGKESMFDLMNYLFSHPVTDTNMPPFTPLSQAAFNAEIDRMYKEAKAAEKAEKAAAKALKAKAAK